MNGTAQIISGFIAFGSLHINTGGFEPWQWLMIICGTLTLITAVCYWYVRARSLMESTARLLASGKVLVPGLTNQRLVLDSGGARYGC